MLHDFLIQLGFYQTHACHTQHQRGSGCRIVWLDTEEKLEDDKVEGSTYVIGAWTAMGSLGKMLGLLR